MLAYHLEWHMRRALAPMLFDDHQRDAAEAERLSPVAKAKVSPAARRKAAAKKTDDGLPVHSFRSLLADLATLTQKHRRLRQEAVHDDPGKAYANTEKGSQTARHKTGSVDRSSSRK